MRWESNLEAVPGTVYIQIITGPRLMGKSAFFKGKGERAGALNFRTVEIYSGLLPDGWLRFEGKENL